jgi:O-antigen/teichoic acid export membrane protein
MSAAPAPSARRAVAFSFAARHAILLLRAASLLVLSRLLGPAEFGTFATAAAIVALVFVFAEFGLHSHLVHVPRFSRAAVGAAVGVSCALNLAAFVLVAAIALMTPEPWLGAEARPVLLLLALATCVQPVALPVTAALQRRLRFGQLMVVDVGRAAASIGLSIGLAVAGLGMMSLAWGAVADAVVGTALALAIGRGRRPAWPRFAGWASVLRFGSPLALTSGLRQAGESGVALAVGASLGTAAVGLLNRAQTVTDMLDKAVLQGVAPVVLPVLTREVRRGGSLAPLYLRKLAILSAIYWPFFAVLFVLAEGVVRLLLGPAWDAAVPVVRALALAGMAGPFTAISMKFFVALDANGSYARLQAVAVAVRLGAVAALALVSLPAAALGLAFANAVRAALITRALEARLAIRMRATGAALAPALLVAAMAAAGPALLAWAGPGAASPAGTLFGGLLALVGWAAGLALTRHELWSEITRFLRSLQHRLPLGRAAPSSSQHPGRP